MAKWVVDKGTAGILFSKKEPKIHKITDLLIFTDQEITNRSDLEKYKGKENITGDYLFFKRSNSKGEEYILAIREHLVTKYD